MVSCLKQGSKINEFCFKQAQGLNSSLAQLYQTSLKCPPPPPLPGLLNNDYLMHTFLNACITALIFNLANQEARKCQAWDERKRKNDIFIFLSFPHLACRPSPLMFFSQSRTKTHLTFVATGGVLTINAKYFTFSIPESFYCWVFFCLQHVHLWFLSCNFWCSLIHLPLQITQLPHHAICFLCDSRRNGYGTKQPTY